jgi:hypothetical protein
MTSPSAWGDGERRPAILLPLLPPPPLTTALFVALFLRAPITVVEAIHGISHPTRVALSRILAFILCILPSKEGGGTTIAVVAGRCRRGGEGAKLLFCALLATYKGLCALQKA